MNFLAGTSVVSWVLQKVVLYIEKVYAVLPDELFVFVWYYKSITFESENKGMYAFE